MRRLYTILFLLILATPNVLFAQDILFPANVNNQWGYVDTSGEWLIEPTYTQAREFSEGLAAAMSYDKWGFIDSKGEWIIPPQFDNAVTFNEGVAAVIFNNRWGFINHDGEFDIEPIFIKASSFSEGLALVSNGEEYFYITHEGNQVGSENFLHALPFAEGMAPIMIDGEKGYIDNSGNLTIKHQFEVAAPFSEGRAQVKENGRWGYIDRNGNIAIPLEYKGSTHFSEGLAAVMKKNEWGYIDKEGTFVIESDFISAQPFSQGFAVAKTKDGYGVIDKSSTWIIQPGFNAIGQAGRSVSVREELILGIQEAFNKWALKGEFEKTEEYVDRMSPENQKESMGWISKRIIDKYGDTEVDFEKAELGFYNADLEEFNIFLPGTLPTSIGVPITEALWFKENWRRGSFRETEYMLAGESLILSSYVFDLEGNKYVYNLEEGNSYLYNYASISWEEEISIPEISWNIADTKKILTAKPGSSDVDTDIPVTKYLNKNIFALIIGNEDYQSFQAGLSNEIDVSYAAIDAEIFSEYAKKTLGVPEENITLIKNGTAGQIKQALAKMSSIAEAYEGKAELLFYYAGHGLPDEDTKKPYLIPVDVNGSDLSFAISLDDALNTLTENEHQRVTVFLDACFTGGGRNDGLVEARGVKIKPKSPFVKGNLVLFSASSGNQSAFAYKEKAHGMFTYYLLKKLQESGGNVTFGELDDYLKSKVRKGSIIYNNKEQNPDLMVSPSLEKVWDKFQLNIPYIPGLSDGQIDP